MQTYKCLIIEDEPIAAEILEDYIAQLSYLQLAGKCENAIDAAQVCTTEKIDLIFLDIHLPKIKGLDFLRSLVNPPQVILTTAYHEYALEGYEFNILDYLLKPIEFERFLKSVNKFHTRMLESGQDNIRKFQYFNVNHKMVKVFLDEILYIESLQEYIKIVTANRSVVTKFQIGEIVESIGSNNLLRVHRSFVVALDKIDAFSSFSIEIKDHTIPIGRNYREQVAQVLSENIRN